MERPRMRPEFAMPLEEPERFWSALSATLETEPGRCVGTLFRRHAVLQMTDEAQHFWSPHLYIEVRDPDEHEPDDPIRSGPHLHGRFAPHPHVWTLFMAIYGLIVMLGVGCTVWGLSVWMLGGAPWILLGAPGAVGLYAFVYGAALIGNGLGAGQMYELRALVDRAIHRADGS